MPRLDLGAYKRHSENNPNISTTTNLDHSQKQNHIALENVDQSIKPAHLKLDERETFNKCGRSKIPVRIKDGSSKISVIPMNETETFLSPKDVN